MLSDPYLSDGSGSFPVMPAQAGIQLFQQIAGGHPAFSADHFWISACAGMTGFE
jgi:hypothetical protein